jgi:hypothetical protein
VAQRVPVHRHKAVPHRRPVVQTHPREVPKAHHLELPSAPFALKWLSGAATPVANRGQDVPARVALVLAALVLASAVLVAAAAREAAR